MDGAPDASGPPHHLFSGAVVPRPIAWVSTRGDDADNLVPYSSSTVVSVDPPVPIFAPAGHGPSLKDIPRDAISRDGSVVSVVTRDPVEAMNETAATVLSGADELDHAGIEKVEAVRADAPRVVDANVASECALYDSMKAGSSTLALGEVVHVHVVDEVLIDGKFDTRELDAVGRLANNEYATTSDRFEFVHPD